MSGAWRWLSWFISSSYSKSEIARSPLTIAMAPVACANSTSSVLKGCTDTLPIDLVAFSMNATRSAALNNVLPLRQGWLTTPTINESYMLEPRPMMSRWPLVIGSNVPGQIATRLSGGDMEDENQGVSVTAAVQRRQVEFKRFPPVAFGDDASTRGEHRRQRRREALSEAARPAVRRVDEHKIVLTSVPPCSFEERVHPLPNGGGLQSERLEVAADRSDRLKR